MTEDFFGTFSVCKLTKKKESNCFHNLTTEFDNENVPKHYNFIVKNQKQRMLNGEMKCYFYSKYSSKYMAGLIV